MGPKGVLELEDFWDIKRKGCLRMVGGYCT